MKILYIGKEIRADSRGGRELLCRLNFNLLYSLYPDNLIKISFPSRRQRGPKALINVCRGYIDGIDDAQLNLVWNSIRGKGITQVFVDGSNLGSFVAAFKQRFPGIEVVTFFHNAEVSFFWGAFCSRKSLKSLAVLLANSIAERIAVRKSDKIICLSERDSHILERLYGRSATHISPIAVKDSLNRAADDDQRLPSGRFALFVGGAFYANVKAIEWYAKYVSHAVSMPLYVVGHGFDQLRSRFEHIENMIVVGSVTSLTDWYRRAHVVVAPIFHGSGMKTKVAESLMHGKRIIGTPEAFSGYEDIAYQAGWFCQDSNVFVAAMNEAMAVDLPVFDSKLRIIYETHYSFKVAKQRFADILAEGIVPFRS
jgi:hypothetical protein